MCSGRGAQAQALHPAVDGECRTGDGGRGGAREIGDGGRHLVGGDQPAGGLAGLQGGAFRRRVVRLVEQPADPGVSAVPGFTQLTRMPSRTWSAAMARVSERTAPLLAL